MWRRMNRRPYHTHLFHRDRLVMRVQAMDNANARLVPLVCLHVSPRSSS